MAADEHGAELAVLYREIGEKVFRLCQTPDAVSANNGGPCESLSVSITAISWRGMATADRDELYYWGGALKPLIALSDGELRLAAKRIQSEIERRTGRGA